MGSWQPYVAHNLAALNAVEPAVRVQLAMLRRLRAEGGRLFVIGNGGGAAHASHAAADFRKIGGMHSFAFDNVAELTARINDEGWSKSIVDWLISHQFNDEDMLMVFSVGGGGTPTDDVSLNLVSAIRYVSYVACAPIIGVCGDFPGQLQKYGTCAILPTKSTTVIEGCQAVVWHYLVQELAE